MGNRIKTVMIFLVVSSLFVGIFALFGGLKGAVIGLLVSVPINFVGYWYSDRFVLAFHSAREIYPGDSQGLHETLERLAIRSGVPVPRLYLVPDAAPNILTVGRSAYQASIAVSQGLVGLLSYDELVAVLAHELGHLRKGDVLLQTVTAAYATTVISVGDFTQWAALLGWSGRRDIEHKKKKLAPFRILLMGFLAPLASLIVKFAMRSTREFEADDLAAKNSGKPESLASALRKIEAANSRMSPIAGTPTMAHLYIVNPYSEVALLRLFSTHPSTELRIKRLFSMVESASLEGNL